jgi:signal transduction histidine kinase
LKYEQERNEAQILELEKANLQKDLSLKKRTIQRNAYLFSGIGLTLVALFLALYLRQRARKDKIIAEQQIRQLEEEKKLLAAKMIVEGQEEERKRIARELHDGLGVLLSATKMQFTSIRDTSPENKPLIERATQLLEQASGDVRKISHNMMPGLLMKLGLYEAIEDLVDNLNDSGKLKAVCEIPEDLARLPENQEIMIYRIVQELVNNTLKHAAASEIRLEISPAPGSVEIRYSDDGKGFDAALMQDVTAMGLKSIESRVDFLNGRMELHTAPGQGVKYLIRVPLPQ